MKQFDLQGNEYDIQIKEMLDNIPKSNNVASAYTGISVDELQTIIAKFKTIPNYNDLINDNNKKDKEIERLKEELGYTIPIVEHNKTITKHLKENKRLNNIVNELEKLLKEEKTRTRYANDVERFTAYDFALKRLQELKGDGSNEKI